MTFKHYLNLVLIFLFIGCTSTKKVVEQSDKKEVVKEHIVSFKDTTFVTPRATSIIRVPFEKIVKQYDTVFVPQVIKQTNGNATAKLIIKRDTILVTADCDTIALTAKIKKEVVKNYERASSVKNEKITKSRGFSIWQYISAIAVSFLLGYIIRSFKIF